MLLNTKEVFLYTLAEILESGKDESQITTDAMELICRQLAFGCGMIYEADYEKQFYLREQYLEDTFTDSERILVPVFPFQEGHDQLYKEMTYITKSTKNTFLDDQLLQEYYAEEIILAPMTDDSCHIYGFVILLNSKQRNSFSSEDLRTIAIIFSLLLRYIKERSYRKRIGQSRSALGDLLDNTGIDIYVNDWHNHDILYVNETMSQPYGGKKMFVGKKCWQVLFPEQTGPCEFCPKHRIVDAKGKPEQLYTWDYQREFDGSWFRVFSAAFYWEDGRLAHIVSSADISDNKRNEALVEYMANYDQLTKLPNRRMLLKECERRIARATDLEQGYVMFFDIDGFKAINDTLGHDAGDEFLVQLGEFFSNIPLLKDGIFRNGGDEFVAIVGGELITKTHIRELANFIHERLKMPWNLNAGDIYCSTSIGVACYPEDGITTDVLLQKADRAMYQVKHSGGHGICFGYQLT